jgi:hypothetical protein
MQKAIHGILMNKVCASYVTSCTHAAVKRESGIGALGLGT